ncbi:SDR family NAD(P)-dependent oxidoreductase [Pontibacillus sp. HMF3514]|uniref:SDR family NAD(P)-dependent oxidoreductase n=1 Tax=Pontibacillus sp. HMF3514 TaxID=2692425 RepID=UPI00131F6AF3|nr:SDR family oxidoreductase [Pontibacillus sp. HMF3514]QHE51271.1 SDR family NAD(P)-dependent oxidoreductase [Pontibacillus sp. HMF3514]
MNHKVVVITGASKGLGKALTLEFANRGAKLGICARGEEALLETKNEAEALGAEVIAVSADASNPNDVERFISVVEDRFGRIDTLINSASKFGHGPCLLADYPLQQFEDVIRVNISNPFLVTKRVLPGMLARNSGSIINVTSEAGNTGFREWGAYGISKFGVEGLTQIWADELDGSGVRMNMVDPGEMNTDMHDIAVPDCNYELADPTERVDVFVYLSSDDSSHVNGERLQAPSFSLEKSDA